MKKLVENSFSSLKNQTTTMQTQNTKTISPTTTNQSNFTNNRERERERERERGRELIEILTSESVLVCSETVQQKLQLQSERERMKRRRESYRWGRGDRRVWDQTHQPDYSSLYSCGLVSWVVLNFILSIIDMGSGVPYIILFNYFYFKKILVWLIF